MQVTGKIVVVTGGANGIGRALCEAFHRAGAAKVVVADLDRAARKPSPPRSTARRSNAMSARKTTSAIVIEETERLFGPIALFCSNAGIGGGFDPLSENAGGDFRRAVRAKLGRSMSWRMSTPRGIWSRA